AILTIAISIAAPSLSHFFRGRSLDSQARMLLAMTRHGQSRAVSEGLPMEMWVDSAQGKFGLEAEPSYETSDPKKLEGQLEPNTKMEVVENTTGTAAAKLNAANSTVQAPVRSNHPNLPRIRFLP